ncbi:cytochrome ubiquinol oxidase subunit I [Bordetella sp. 2513F-2]
MNLPPLLLARVQFLGSFSFLALFMALALGLAWMLLYFKIRARTSGAPGWTAAYRFWVRIFALCFVLALAAVLPVLIQFGSIWSGLMDKIGNVAGPLVGFGVLSVFILKSCFLGVMLFGQRRVSDLAHTLAVFMVALGQLVATGWLVSLHGWMQTPDGAALIDGRYQVYDWMAVVFNPSFGWSMALAVLGAALAAAFLVLGVTALQALRRPVDEGERCAFKTALVTAALASALQVPAAAGMADLVARYQPAKAAALAGYWHSGAEPAIVLVGWPDAAAQRNLGEWALHGQGGRWLGRDPGGVYLGLDKFSGMQPPVALTFWSLRAAVLLGLAMLLVSWAVLLRTVRRSLDIAVLGRGTLRVLIAFMGAGAVAVVAGWWVSLLGLQPFVVNRVITQSEVLSPVSVASLAYGVGGYTAVYVALLAAFAGMLFHAARYGVVPVRKAGGAT